MLCFVISYFGSSSHIKTGHLMRKLFPRQFYEMPEEGKLRDLTKQIDALFQNVFLENPG